MRVLLIDQQVQHLGQGQPGYQGFQVDENNCSSICRSCVFPSGTEGMNHGTESRLPDGSGAMPSVNQLGLDFARTMPQFPFQSPWDSSGISRWFLLAGCHNSKSKLKPDGFRSSSMASIRFSPTLTGILWRFRNTCFSPYPFLHP